MPFAGVAQGGMNVPPLPQKLFGAIDFGYPEWWGSKVSGTNLFTTGVPTRQCFHQGGRRELSSGFTPGTNSPNYKHSLFFGGEGVAERKNSSSQLDRH